jgi:mRNA interferase MazF
MTTYRRGDVVLVPFPFSDQSTAKKRPAVVISSTLYNETSPDIVILAVTSKVEKSVSIGECLVADWKEAGLLKPSAIKPAISTIEKSLVLKKLGALSPRDSSSMNKVIKGFLDLK